MRNQLDTEELDWNRDINFEQLLEAERWSDYEEPEENEGPTRRAAKSPIHKAKQSGARVIEKIEEGEYKGPLASFYEDQLIVGTPTVVKSGKEATVYCCPAHPATGKTWLAAKVYRDRQNRSFKNDAVYMQGRTTFDKRLDKAIATKSNKGREAQFAVWIGAEYGTLRALHAAGADVPRPYGCGESALLLDYYGEPGMAAPQLQNVTLAPEQAPALFEQMVRNLAIFLDCDRVHGDLSAYNILYWEDRLQIIDFPQAVDPMDNPDAYGLFVRDVANVCEYFALYGVTSEPRALALSLWMKSGRAKPKG